jgi:NADH-quinone oxidoreductase subunit J
MELVVFVIGAAIIVVGALGVVLGSNPVHAALSLVMTLFGVAVLFIAQDAHFLAAVQVIVYAGAIVVLFLFVIMLLGVDRVEDLTVDPLKGQRPAAIIVGVAVLGLVIGSIIIGGEHLITGAHSSNGALDSSEPNINVLARSLFSRYVFAFEVTSVLLVIAVVGTVLLARRPAAREVPESRSEEQSEGVAR